jgi:ABC-2 type transport system permease protein
VPVAAEVTWWLLVQLPGLVLALVLASLRFHIHLVVGWMAVPAIVMVALTGAAVGYAMSSVLPAQVASQITSFLSVGILLYSPIDFPVGRLPLVMRDIHHVLPVEYMADIVRGSLTGRYDSTPALAFAVVGFWCAAGLALSYRAAIRRV